MNNQVEAIVLMGLQGKTQYEGTVPHGVKEERRRKNRRAKQSRKVNRGNR